MTWKTVSLDSIKVLGSIYHKLLSQLQIRAYFHLKGPYFRRGADGKVLLRNFHDIRLCVTTNQSHAMTSDSTLKIPHRESVGTRLNFPLVAAHVWIFARKYVQPITDATRVYVIKRQFCSSNQTLDISWAGEVHKGVEVSVCFGRLRLTLQS